MQMQCWDFLLQDNEEQFLQIKTIIQRKKTVLSPDFTIEDIHKLREYNYEMIKHMTDEERMDFIKWFEKILKGAVG